MAHGHAQSPDQIVLPVNLATPNFIVGVIGLVLLLCGIISQELHAEIFQMGATALSGVGGSIFATAFVSWLLTRSIDKLPIDIIIAALAERTRFIRKEHEATLIFENEGDHVKVTKMHKFKLHNPGYSRTILLSMYTDTMSWQGQDRKHGFTRVDEPEGHSLEGAALEAYVRSENGKVVFRKEYRIPQGKLQSFGFISVECFRKRDRLIWTVQDLADDFHISIQNYTGKNQIFRIKINHQDESEISKRAVPHSPDAGSAELFNFSFGAAVLPYQGFEVMWDMDAGASVAGAAAKQDRTPHGDIE